MNHKCGLLCCISDHDVSLIATQSIVPLVESLKVLAGPETCIICSYEQRTEGINPKVEKQFFEVSSSFEVTDELLCNCNPSISD